MMLISNKLLKPLISIIFLISLAACGPSDEDADSTTGIASTSVEQTAVAKPSGSPTIRRTPIPTPEEPALKQYDAPPPMTIDPEKNYTATITLAKGGEFKMELYPKESPTTVNSFVFLSRDGYYDGVTFHRVIEGLSLIHI